MSDVKFAKYSNKLHFFKYVSVKLESRKRQTQNGFHFQGFPPWETGGEFLLFFQSWKLQAWNYLRRKYMYGIVKCESFVVKSFGFVKAVIAFCIINNKLFSFGFSTW